MQVGSRSDRIWHMTVSVNWWLLFGSPYNKDERCWCLFWPPTFANPHVVTI